MNSSSFHFPKWIHYIFNVNIHKCLLFYTTNQNIIHKSSLTLLRKFIFNNVIIEKHRSRVEVAMIKPKVSYNNICTKGKEWCFHVFNIKCKRNMNSCVLKYNKITFVWLWLDKGDSSCWIWTIIKLYSIECNDDVAKKTKIFFADDYVWCRTL